MKWGKRKKVHGPGIRGEESGRGMRPCCKLAHQSRVSATPSETETQPSCACSFKEASGDAIRSHNRETTFQKHACQTKWWEEKEDEENVKRRKIAIALSFRSFFTLGMIPVPHALWAGETVGNGVDVVSTGSHPALPACGGSYRCVHGPSVPSSLSCRPDEKTRATPHARNRLSPPFVSIGTPTKMSRR